MANPRGSRKASDQLTRTRYALQPVRSRTRQLVLWGTACVSCLILGAAVAGAYFQHSGTVPFELCEPSASEADLQAELARTQLALTQERASRAAVQKVADASAADASRLTTELLFLRGQKQAPR
ncbi:hypothetical protein QS306_15265 [Paraburkholderia bonniea]|uniref:hypothetical protein n=1 Tax=Paraburkholderia bonniea TaxID=2152891 RepID=UPI001292A7B4|nr:hypothetical protein [Paraburkholderia bonniea]WJF92118.1 hypothetical protein QS306_15265 [Paraburkholderia bonniea]WJF95438.1 hypothetical protein QS308_15270 [Paraburkholderia bonniea]